MSARFAYRKSWGSELLDGGGARFRLWAPGVESLWLVAKGSRLAMNPVGDGWFECAIPEMASGDSYAFSLPDGTLVPDPAARAQAGDVHGPSLLVEPLAYEWRCGDWPGRPWPEAVIYETHVGTFTELGTFKAVLERLDHLAATGITALELMPVAQYEGNRGWGYDGVLMYAPHHVYGGPDALKELVDAAHERGLMVILDVVYNHFGPDGNYLHHYAPSFFHSERQTPWGGAIAYDVPAVRDYFVDNTLYWLEEFRFDGLRFDAIDQIEDVSEVNILDEIGRLVRTRITDRHIHLTTEDDRNLTRFHEKDRAEAPGYYTAEWNDDFHHAAHVIATRETEGYYVDYAAGRVEKLARSLAEGFVYQGEVSRFRDNSPRGVPSAHLPPTTFINFLQNHDQIGNRAFNERLVTLAPAQVIEALLALLILGPHIPLLFMGEEYGETRSFGFFTDFQGELAEAVREGRRREFRRFARFADEANRDRIPDPNAESTFRTSQLDWARLASKRGRSRHELVSRLLAIRRGEITPRLAGIDGHAGRAETRDDRTLGVVWQLADGAELRMLANLSDDPGPVAFAGGGGRLLFESWPGLSRAVGAGDLPGWAVLVFLNDDGGPQAEAK